MNGKSNGKRAEERWRFGRERGGCAVTAEVEKVGNVLKAGEMF